MLHNLLKNLAELTQNCTISLKFLKFKSLMNCLWGRNQTAPCSNLLSWNIRKFCELPILSKMRWKFCSNKVPTGHNNNTRIRITILNKLKKFWKVKEFSTISQKVPKMLNLSQQTAEGTLLSTSRQNQIRSRDSRFLRWKEEIAPQIWIDPILPPTTTWTLEFFKPSKVNRKSWLKLACRDKASNYPQNCKIGYILPTEVKRIPSLTRKRPVELLQVLIRWPVNELFTNR